MRMGEYGSVRPVRETWQNKGKRSLRLIKSKTRSKVQNPMNTQNSRNKLRKLTGTNKRRTQYDTTRQHRKTENTYL